MENDRIRDVEKDMLTPDIMEEAAKNMTTEKKREVDQEKADQMKTMLLKNFSRKMVEHECAWKDEFKVNGMTPTQFFRLFSIQKTKAVRQSADGEALIMNNELGDFLDFEKNV